VTTQRDRRQDFSETEIETTVGDSAGAPEEIEISPELIEAVVAAVWPEPKPPAFIRRQVARIYWEMKKVRRLVARASSRLQ
jgi:hypothetical protein